MDGVRNDSTATFDGSAHADVGVELLTPGTRLGERYEVRRVIDWGGYAVVYHAHDRELNRDIALKVLRRDRDSPEAFTRFRREVAVAREAASPHLVRVFDIESSDGAMYLTMELVDGASLKKRLQRGAPPIEEIVRIAGELMEGLAALHRLGIIHRDVKPGNVLIDSAGRVKLTDFGLARQLASDDETATATGALLGTLAYVSPEQALGQDVDHRSDLYGAGIVLFEMLTGRTPFQTKSALGSLLARTRTAAGNVRALRPDCPRWVAAVVRRLLEPDPANRYATADAVLLDLRRKRVSLRRPSTRFVAGSLLAGVAVAGAFFVSPMLWAPPTLSHLRAVPDGIVAVSGSGSVLWRLPNIDLANSRYTVVEHGHNGKMEVAAIFAKAGATRASRQHHLSFLDARTGEITRRVLLPSAAANFPDLTPVYAVDSIISVDLNHDGGNEVLITMTHWPEWPSYTVIYEPRSERARVVFAASGHHRYAASRDLDGDGHDEVLFYGINNAYGWYNAAAAVRIIPSVESAFDDNPIIAATPDAQQTASTEEAMLWYTLLPKGFISDRARFRLGTNSFAIPYAKSKLSLGLDGVLTALPDRRVERRAARERAYRLGREADRLAESGAFDQALERLATAIDQGREAGEPVLVEALELRRASLLARSGRIAEAQTSFMRIRHQSPAPSDVDLAAARALHLSGDVAKAIPWYERGLAGAPPHGEGSSVHEFLQGLVLALSDQHRWKEAEEWVDRFHLARAQPRSDWTSLYREYVRWRSGRVPYFADIHTPQSPIDVIRYWYLEFDYARGTRAADLLSRFDPDLERHSQVRSMVLSLKAELTAAVGRPDDARDLITRAMDLAQADRRRSTAVASHYDLVAQRHARLTKGRS
jgi:serine/threonine protein kinase/tetratricopeptide (TPR) repeat protein